MSNSDNWRDSANCKNDKGFIERSEMEQVSVCHSCPLWVQTECLAFALDNESPISSPPFGWPVYGKVTAHERQTILRRRRAEATERARRAMKAVS